LTSDKLAHSATPHFILVFGGILSTLPKAASGFKLAFNLSKSIGRLA
jgi:hypothetical protein